MHTCPRCAAAVSPSNRFCPSCGAALPEDPPLPTGPYQPPSTPAPPAGERFAPGALLAGRYRVVALLGKGGMGEVYRADDLTLGQPVALKFLPAHLAGDPDRLMRFRKEVAVARQVSHPNVCRVYDIAEHQGDAFLTMEFIDGEDLASVLRRFGRLPEERAVEAARQLCSALAAVHEQGLLHRDLKPHNVMLDGRGKVRLTDFGLAALAGDVGDLASGTPLYMAPEQLAGREVSVRSDLFSLGLVLYELFTGRKAFTATTREELARKYAEETPSKPSSHVSGMNAAVEGVVLRCLERKPEDRPKSAYEVLAALPGGDPLAAAVAAGQTPSPQMVADAGAEGRIRPWVGAALLAVVLVGMWLIAVLADYTMLFRRVPLNEPPEALARQAQRLLADLGYSEKPADTAYYYRVDGEYLRHTLSHDASPQRWDGLTTGRPAAMYFFYRQSTAPLVPTLVPGSPGLLPDPNNPPAAPGMAGVHLDVKGRLLYLYVLPARHYADEAGPAPGDWHRPLFDAAGLEPLSFRVTSPQWSPPGPCDERRAWVGTFPDRPDQEVRVEAAVFRGRPVYFEIIGPWKRASSSEEAGNTLWVLIFWGVMTLTVLLAVRNLRLGRCDLRGALRMALFILAACYAGWLVAGHHSLSVGAEFSQMIAVFGTVGYLAVTLVLIYLAMEPALRSRWPWRITAWNRLLAGRFRDPLVGRDLLTGAACAVALTVVVQLGQFAFEWSGLPPLPPQTGCGPNWVLDPGPPTPLYYLLYNMFIAVYIPIYLMMVAFACFLLLRREWLAWVAFGAICVGMYFPAYRGPTAAANALTLVWASLFAAAIVFVLRRFGLLAFASFVWCGDLLALSPLTTDVSAWYFARGLAAALAVAALALYGFWTATVGQRLFKESFFGEA
jgi:serine/threonine-protein kinase